MKKLLSMAASGAIALSLAAPAFAEDGMSSGGRMMMRSPTEQNLRSGPSRRNLRATPIKRPKGQQGERRAVDQSPAATAANEACMAAAVTKREAALMAAMETEQDAVTAAYAARSKALAAAWTETDATVRQNAIRAAWDAFKLSSKTARVAWMDASKTAWTTFKEDAKACGNTSTGEEGAESVDAAM